MSQSPAQKAAFDKMIAARKVKSGKTGEAESAASNVKPTVTSKGNASTKPVFKSKKTNNKSMTPAAVSKVADRIKRRISAKSKGKTEVGFD